MLGFPREHPDLVKEALIKQRDHLHKTTGRSPNRVILCAEYLKTALLKNLLDQAENYLKRGSFRNFALWYDISSGFGTVTSGLEVADSVKRGGADIFAAEQVALAQSYFGVLGSVSKSADAYLRLQRHAARHASFMRIDDSGFLFQR